MAELDEPGHKAEKKLSAALNRDFRAELEDSKGGRELLEAWKRDGVTVPPLLVSTLESTDIKAFYSPDGNYIRVNADVIREAHAWADELSDQELREHLLKHPAHRRAVAADLRGSFLHEAWHADQLKRFPFNQMDSEVWEYMELEYHAEAKAAVDFMERARARRSLLDSPREGLDFQADSAARYASDPDEFRKSMKRTYKEAAGPMALDLDEAVARDQKQLHQEKDPEQLALLREELALLQKARTQLRKEIAQTERERLKPEDAAAYLLAYGASLVKRDPRSALDWLIDAAEIGRTEAKAWLEASKTPLWKAMGAALDNEKAAFAEACPAEVRGGQDCSDRLEDLKDACSYLEAPCAGY